MNNIKIIFTVAIFFSLMSQASLSHDEKNAHNQDKPDAPKTVQGAEKNHKDRTIHINQKLAQEAGIKTASANSGDIHQQITTYGKIVTDPSHISHIRARFPGTVLEVKVGIGQKVKKGDVLAFIEANQSLSRYSIKAPFDGVITARHANPGELAQEQPLFTVADYSFMWAELKVFPQDMSKIKAQQKVTLMINDRTLESEIDHVLPNDNDDPFILARVSINNPNNQLSAGMMAKGFVSISQKNVAVAVNNDAIHELEGSNVVFVKIADGFEARKVILGQSDGIHTEILSGLTQGEIFASVNSYILKADLLKSGAEHAH